MGEKFLVLEGKREQYCPCWLRRTMTVGELRELLTHYDDDLPVILSSDDGYLYGSINNYDFRTEEYDEDNNKIDVVPFEE